MAKHSNILLDDDILLFQILPRLSVRSLGRCKCVCKQWRSLLTTPVFTKMHLHHVNNQNHPKQLVVSTTKPCKYFRTIDCETPEVGLSAKRSIPFQANEMSIISSLHGLVCVGINSLPPHSGRYSDIILWNPSTGDFKTLSKDNSHANCFTIPAIGYGFYYSSCDDDYKLLRVTKSGDAYIYLLKSDSWRKVESTSCCLSKYWHLSCLLNENLYLLALDRKKTNLRSYSIIRFDTEAEKFTEMAPPPCLEYVATYACFSLTVVSGCIHLWVGSNSKGVNSWDKLDLWKMDEKGEWTNVVSCCHMLCKLVFFQAMHLMKNGNWLVVSRCRGRCYAHEVDLEMKTIKKVCTYSHGTMHIWGGKFVETIVSLNRK